MPNSLTCVQHAPEATHLGDLSRLSVRSSCRRGCLFTGARRLRRPHATRSRACRAPADPSPGTRARSAGKDALHRIAAPVGSRKRVAAQQDGAGTHARFSFAPASAPSLSTGSLPTDAHRGENLLLLGLRRLRRIIATTTKICAAGASTVPRGTPSAAPARPPTYRCASAAA